MTPKQRILAVRLIEKIEKNPEYAKQLGIEAAIRINQTYNNSENKDNKKYSVIFKEYNND
ncbi:MAG: hypothetical protein IJZ07_03920 [Clostridia bacterium]|nr:hypothetical protein [Clostridia bacterium]